MSVLDRDLISKICQTDLLQDLQFVSFDVETTGLSPVVSRLVELSGVKFRLGSDECDTFSSLINPGLTIPPEVSAIHGISDDMVANAPACNAVVCDFMRWIGPTDTVLVAHNAPFDVEFLHVSLAKNKMVRPANRVIDTLPLSRALLNDVANHQLKTLVEHLSLDAGGYHRALADSFHVKHVLERLVSGNTLLTFDQLEEIGCVLNFETDLYKLETPVELRETISCIETAIDSGFTITFVYSGYRNFKRTVDPLSLIQSRGSYYLTAYCQKMLAERTFRLDRMSKLKTNATQRSTVEPAEAAS